MLILLYLKTPHNLFSRTNFVYERVKETSITRSMCKQIYESQKLKKYEVKQNYNDTKLKKEQEDQEFTHINSMKR